ncbi:MAG: S-layer homology domain-containing protein, partial [Firmicutes bacterium]|nr:S-layer homology domain-containing protein [Bacillota bacterium]
ACPGGHFPLSEMKSLVKRGGEMIYNYIDENMPEWAREAVQWAVDNGIVKGDENGLNLDDRDLRYLVFLYRSKGVR